MSSRVASQWTGPRKKHVKLVVFIMQSHFRERFTILGWFWFRIAGGANKQIRNWSAPYISLIIQYTLEFS